MRKYDNGLKEQRELQDQIDQFKLDLRNCVKRERFYEFQKKLEEFVKMDQFYDLQKDMSDTVKKSEFSTIYDELKFFQKDMSQYQIKSDCNK